LTPHLTRGRGTPLSRTPRVRELWRHVCSTQVLGGGSVSDLFCGQRYVWVSGKRVLLKAKLTGEIESILEIPGGMLLWYE